jgi:hypothetical protein
VSLLRLTDEDVDVMVVRLLFSAVLSGSTSLPLVEVLDKGALSLAISPELVPIVRGNQSSWVQKAPFQPFLELLAKSEDCPLKFAICIGRKELPLSFLLSRPKRQRGGKRRHMVGCTVEFFLAQTFNLRETFVATFTRGSKHVENSSSNTAVGSCRHCLLAH